MYGAVPASATSRSQTLQGPVSSTRVNRAVTAKNAFAAAGFITAGECIMFHVQYEQFGLVCTFV